MDNEYLDPFYPKPILILKPNLDPSQVYQIIEKDNDSRSKYKHFSSRELDNAVRRAKEEIKEELSETNKNWAVFIDSVSGKDDLGPEDRNTTEEDQKTEEVEVSSKTPHLQQSPRRAVTRVKLPAAAADFPSTHHQIQQENRCDDCTDDPSNSRTSDRITACLTQIEQTFDNIFAAISVNRKHYLPTNPLEQEKVTKRTREFVTRFGRSLYQAKQQYLSLRHAVTKQSLSQGGGSSQSQHLPKLVQLLRCCLQLLLSYLHHVPLSGGCYFPAIINDSLETLLDVGNLAADLQVATGPLAGNIRRLEEMFCQSVEEANQVLEAGQAGLGVFNNLARDMFGPPSPKKTLAKPKMRGAVSGTPKPRGNKLLQARTNMARMKRMKDAEHEQKGNTFGSEKPNDPAATTPRRRVTAINEMPEPIVENRSTITYEQVNRSQPEVGDLRRILRRLHNLELLTLNQSSEKVYEAQAPPIIKEMMEEYPSSAEPEKDDQTQHDLIQTKTRATLEMADKRLKIIQNDFDVIAKKYGLDNADDVKEKPEKLKEVPRSTFSPVSLQKPKDHTPSIGDPTQQLMATVCDSMVRDIAAQVSIEMLQPEIISQLLKNELN